MTASSIKRSKKPFAIVALVIFLVAGGGVAFAYWTTTGAGTGTGGTGTSTPVTMTQTSTVTNLRPGGAPQTLAGSFTNTNSGPVYVTSVTATVASVAKTTVAPIPAGTCDATDYVITAGTMTVGADIPVGTAQGAWTGAQVAFVNKATNQDGCKGATVTFAYTSN